MIYTNKAYCLQSIVYLYINDNIISCQYIIAVADDMFGIYIHDVLQVSHVDWGHILLI